MLGGSAIVLISYLTAFVGSFGGAVFAANSKKGKLQGVVMGFSAGILIALVCFEMLPEIFSKYGLLSGLFGILLGTAFAIFLDSKFRGSGVMLGIAIMLHGFPEGIALGSMLNQNFLGGLYVAAIICLHCFPESVALSLSLIKEKISKPIILLVPFVIALPRAFGAMLSNQLQDVSGGLSSLCFSFAGGVMIYLCCANILPEARESGKLATFAAIFGFVLGVLIIT